MTFITKELINKVQPFVKKPNVINNLCIAIDLLSKQFTNTIENREIGNEIHSVISSLITESLGSVPNVVDYLTGKGPVADYFTNYLMFTNFIHVDNTNAISEEIDSKFNLKPSLDINDFECQYINQALFSIDNSIAMKAFPETTWIEITENHPIITSGFYIYPDGTKVVNLVTHVNGVCIFYSICGDSQPKIICIHEWENVRLDITDICYFPGSLDVLLQEIKKISTV